MPVGEIPFTRVRLDVDDLEGSLRVIVGIEDIA